LQIKNVRSVREIPIADIVVETLQRWREKQIKRPKYPDVTVGLTAPLFLLMMMEV